MTMSDFHRCIVQRVSFVKRVVRAAEIRYYEIRQYSRKGPPFLSVMQTLLPRSSLICSLCLSVNVVILVLLAVAFLIIVERNLLNLSDFLYKESPGMFTGLQCVAVKTLVAVAPCRQTDRFVNPMS